MAAEEARDGLSSWLDAAADAAQARFVEAHEAREAALRRSREVIRNSANAIRAAHRGEFALAQELLDTVSELAQEMEGVLRDHPRVYYGGFVEDALKEYAEASATLAFLRGTAPPTQDDLRIGVGPYLNGLAEAIGELRRAILDSLRADDFSRADTFLGIMDDVYSILVSMDFPEAVTGGLRRRTDAARGILERTRGDVTLAMRQRSLERKLAAFEGSITGGEGGGSDTG